MEKLKSKKLQRNAKPKSEKNKKPKKRLIKVYYKGDLLITRIKLMQKLKHNFTLQFTGYTALIKNETLNQDYFFTKENAKGSFDVTRKIKAEIKERDIHLDVINKSNVKYFRLNNLKPCVIKTVYNVDINSAYPKALLNLGLISVELFNELQVMDKSKKLKAIGQLATNKTIYVFEKGEQITYYQKTDEQMRNIWFALCNEVGEAIDECKRNCNTFLFYWFDGIYFTDKDEAQKMIDILKARNFESKLEILNNFIVTETEDFINIKYGKKDCEKNFKLPKSENINYSN